MNLSQEAIQKILGIETPICIDAKEMAKSLSVTFFPTSLKISPDIEAFKDKLQKTLKYLDINIMAYERSLVSASTEKKKIKKGVVVIAFGNSRMGNYPVDHIISPIENQIITVIDKPTKIKKRLPYEERMSLGTELLVRYMSSVIICVEKREWIIYTLNGFSPLYQTNDNFAYNILNNLIPKIASRIHPPRLSEFKIKRNNFSEKSQIYPYVEDLVESSNLFAQSRLFPQKKVINEFRFRSNFYKFIVNLYLDNRIGLSYGFLARQLPVKLEKPFLYKDAKRMLGISSFRQKDFLVKDKKIYILLEINKETLFLRVPPVWVFISCSGAEKTKLEPMRDVLKVGLINGKMMLGLPLSAGFQQGHRPSFDTRVILSHCVANAIYASVLFHFKKDAVFPNAIRNNGMALAHWHGDIFPEFIPKGWHIYGDKNLPFPCGSYQSAIYAFKGKEKAIENSLLNNESFLGDVHIEPQHGINMTWKTLKGLGYYMLSDPLISKLDRRKL